MNFYGFSGSQDIIIRQRQLCDNVPIFAVPNDEKMSRKWSEICKVTFIPSDRLCINHFSYIHMVIAEKKDFIA